MSNKNETFFTSVGCMDGRVQGPVTDFGRKKFGAKFADTITETGLVRQLSNNPPQSLLDSIKQKLLISVEKHLSKGIIVHGHQECAGNPVSSERHKKDVQKSVKAIQSLINSRVPVFGVFVKRSKDDLNIWEAEEL